MWAARALWSTFRLEVASRYRRLIDELPRPLALNTTLLEGAVDVRVEVFDEPRERVLALHQSLRSVGVELPRSGQDVGSKLAAPILGRLRGLGDRAGAQEHLRSVRGLDLREGDVRRDAVLRVATCLLEVEAHGLEELVVGERVRDRRRELGAIAGEGTAAAGGGDALRAHGGFHGFQHSEHRRLSTPYSADGGLVDRQVGHAVRGVETRGVAIAGAGVDELAEAAGGAALAREGASAGLVAAVGSGVVAGVGAGDGAVEHRWGSAPSPRPTASFEGSAPGVTVSLVG